MRLMTVLLLVSIPATALAQAPAPTKGNDVMLNTGSSMTFDPGCILAMISGETGAVTIDWPCVERAATKYDPTNNRAEVTSSIAVMLKAVRDGTAKAKE